MGRDPPEQVGQVIALEDVWAAARKSLSPPKAFCKLYIQEGTDAKSGKWAASKGKLGEEAIDYYLVCCDCCRCALPWFSSILGLFVHYSRVFILTTLPPKQRHLRVNAPVEQRRL